MDDKCRLELLPVDLQLTVLGKMGWKEFATLACASKHFRGLARGINAQPIWNTELTQEWPDYEDDVFRRFEKETEDFTDPYLGTRYKRIIRGTYGLERTVVGRMLSKLNFSSRPDLCLVFASPVWADQLSSTLLHKVLHRLLPPCCSIVIGYGEGIKARSGTSSPLEVDAGYEGISISLLHLPAGVELSVAYQPHNSTALTGKLPAYGEKSTHFFQVAACSNAQHRALRMLTSRFPDSSVIGGTLYRGGEFKAGGVAVYITPQHGATEAVSPEALTAEQQTGRLMRGAVVIGLTGANVEVHPVAVRGIVAEPEGFRVDQAVLPIIAFPDSKDRVRTFVVAVTKVVRVVDEHGRLDFRPTSAVQTLQESADEESAEEMAREEMSSFIHLSDEIDKSPTRSFVVYHRTAEGFRQEFALVPKVKITSEDVNNFIWSLRSRVVSNAAMLQPGSVICWGQQQRGEQNAEDWTAALSHVKQQLPPSLTQCQAGRSSPRNVMRPHAVLGAFHAASCCRGWPLYTPEEDWRTAKRLNVETTIFDRIFPRAPIAGFAALRELGPPPVRECFGGRAKVKELALTTVAAIICLKPERPPDM